MKKGIRIGVLLLLVGVFMTLLVMNTNSKPKNEDKVWDVAATIGDMALNGATTCTGFTGGLTISRSLLAYKALTTDDALTVTGTGGASSTLEGNITTAGAQSYGGEVQ